MPSISLVGADEIDLDEYVDLQVASYRAHLETYGVGTAFINRSLYEWKYSPPAGTGKLAIAVERGHLLAAVAALPLWIQADGKRALAWRVVDIATHPAARGKGLFTRLLSALREDLGPDEILASFPNRNSTPGFKKIGCRDADYAPIWLRLVVPGFRSRPTSGVRLQEFSACRDEMLSELLTTPARTSFLRDRDYLDWRYVRHPGHSYQKYFLDAGRSDSGLIVFRETELYRRRVVVVLEWWGSTARTAAGMLANATNYCREHRIRIMITVTNAIGVPTALRNRFLRTPNSLSPKRHVLRGFAKGRLAVDMFHRSWSIQMGDLDGF